MKNLETSKKFRTIETRSDLTQEFRVEIVKQITRNAVVSGKCHKSAESEYILHRTEGTDMSHESSRFKEVEDCKHSHRKKIDFFKRD